MKQRQLLHGEAIAELLLNFLHELGLDPNLIRGQGYDAAANMAGIHKGARAVIQREYPRAVYVHCRAHALNLAVVKSCENPYIRNMLGVVERVAVFFGDSAKRYLRLSESISNSETEAFPNRRGLPTMSETRWSSRAVTTETFVGNYEAIHDALVGLAHDGDGTALASTETDDFIIALVVASGRPVSWVHQHTFSQAAVHLNLIESYSEAENIIECLQDERSSECFSRLVQKAQQMLGRPLQLPRIAYRTMHRPNVPAGDAEEHYLRNLYFPFLDHLLCEINDRLCSVEVKALVKGGLLLPPALSSIHRELASALDPLDVYKQWDQSGSRRIYLAFNSATNTS